MLIKTQVKRRTQSINQYILSLKQKVYDSRYKEAKALLTHSRQSINNSYMAPYDPNIYLLDSLKAKNQKLRRQKQSMQRQIMIKAQEVSKIKIKRGYGRDINLYKSQSIQNYEFVLKISCEDVGVYMSRLQLKLEDVEKIDYETANIQTDFCILRVVVQDFFVNLLFSQMISIEFDGCYILLSWKNEGSDNNKNNIIIKFWNEEQRIFWSRSFSFSKLICESKQKQKLFFKQQQQYNINTNLEADTKTAQQAMIKEIFEKNVTINRFPNLHLGSNKSPAMDRLRRRSEYYPNMPAIGNNMGLINRSKSRKVSEDLTLKDQGNKNSFGNDKRLNNQKSQKSFEDEMSVSNSVHEQKQDPKKDSGKKLQPNAKLEKLKQEKEKLYSDSKLNQNTHSNRQIFFNESSIHWIEEENQQTISKSSHSKNILSKRNFSDFNKEGAFVDNQKNQHISEVAAEIEESPLLPYSVRDKSKGNKNGEKFEVRIKQVPMTNGSDKKNKDNELSQSKSGRSGSSKKLRNMIKSKRGSEMQDAKEDEQEEEESESGYKNNQIQSINEQSIGEQQQKQLPINGKPSLQVEDKSQDLASQNQNFETESTKYELDDLISGILLLKCSPDGWKPHLKKLHLSNNNSQLCWKNEKGDDLKKIDISDIERISYDSGTITEGIMKHIKVIEKRRCLVIRYQQKNKTKMLQFYLPDGHAIEQLSSFYQKLNRYVRYKNNES